MNLYELLQQVKRDRKFSLNTKTNDIEDNLAELLGTSKDDYYYIGTANLVDNYYKNNPNSEWYIKSIFELGFPFLFFTNVNFDLTAESIYNLITRKILDNQYWTLYVFSKQKPEKIIIGFNEHESLAFKYTLGAKEYDDNYPNPEELIESFLPPAVSERFFSYMWEACNQIEKCISEDIIPELSREDYKQMMYTFNSIPFDAFNLSYLHNLSRYKKSVLDNFGLPSKNESLKKLSECTEYLSAGAELEKDFNIQKGDIVCYDCTFDDYRQSFNLDLYISDKDEIVETNFVIRPKDISPYYIWNVLMSEYNIDYSLKNIIHCEDDMDPVDIGNNSIFITDKIDESYYKKLYELHKQSKFSIQQKLESNIHTTFYDSNAKEIILKDLNEVKDCFNAKAYKAAIILAGSILEAFLIDWLSEKDNKNYFEVDLMIFDKYHKRYRRADLIDYINTINELEKPHWMDAADKATTIRKKRNLVHAKLYINDNDISKETCTQVIDYLEYVINTRWK